MNIIHYNLLKFQSDNKLNNDGMATLLNVPIKKYKQMKRKDYKFLEDEVTNIVNRLHLDKVSFVNTIEETINLKERKIYGTNYLYLKYVIKDYKEHFINTISCIVDVIFMIISILAIITKQIDFTIEASSFVSNLKIILLVEVFVLPFMFIVFPVLKGYFNRTYIASLKSKIKEENKEEACGIILGCLKRSINKSIILFAFTIFSEGVFSLYSLLYMLETKINFTIILILILFIISFVISIMCLNVIFGKNKTRVTSDEI